MSSLFPIFVPGSVKPVKKGPCATQGCSARKTIMTLTRHRVKLKFCSDDCFGRWLTWEAVIRPQCLETCDGCRDVVQTENLCAECSTQKHQDERLGLLHDLGRYRYQHAADSRERKRRLIEEWDKREECMEEHIIRIAEKRVLTTQA